MIASDDCDCPEQDLNKWYEATKCNSTYTQIELDMKKLDRFDMNKMRKAIIEKYNQPYSISLCHYVILNNEVRIFKSI